MQRRALPIAVVVLGGLLVWLWLLERAPSEPDPVPITTSPLWPAFSADVVTGFTIHDKGEPAVHVVRAADGWRATLLDDGRARRAHAPLAQAAASALAGLESTRTLGADTGAYGLGDGALRVTVELGDEQRTVTIGDPLTVGHGHYARIDGADAVHVIPSGPLLALTRDPLEFRDPRVLPLEPEAITAIRSGLSDPPLALERRDRSWHLEPGPGGRVDENAIATLLEDLTGLAARTWESSDATASGPSIALDTAAGTVELQLVEPLPSPWPSTAVVRVTGPVPEPSDADQLATISLDALAALAGAADAWRAEELVALNPWLVRTFTWSAGGSSWSFEQADGTWSGPEEAGDPLTNARVHGFLQRVDALRGVRWVPEAKTIGLVETARISGEHTDGSPFELRLLRGPSREWAQDPSEFGVREVSEDADALLGQLRPLPEDG